MTTNNPERANIRISPESDRDWIAERINEKLDAYKEKLEEKIDARFEKQGAKIDKMSDRVGVLENFKQYQIGLATAFTACGALFGWLLKTFSQNIFK